MTRAANTTAGGTDSAPPPPMPEVQDLRLQLAAAVQEVNQLRGLVTSLGAEVRQLLSEVTALRGPVGRADQASPPVQRPTDSGTRRAEEARRKVRDVLDKMADIHEAARTDDPPVGQ